jgi:4-amino-4-deoxy-L-arabinose transferase-like glycosyltransferase
MKLPGIYAAYAAIFAAFGETPAAIHLGLLLMTAATALLLYFLTAKLFGRLAGVVSACCYALLSTSTSVLGFQAHATNFVVMPAMLGILLLLYALDTNTGSSWLFLASGFVSGIAFLMKQHGLFFVLFCFMYLVGRKCKIKIKMKTKPTRREIIRDATLFAAGAAVPYALACWLLYRAGVFHQFWFWTVSYAGEYSKMGFHRAVRAFVENFGLVIAPSIPIWILALIGMTAPLWNATARRHSGFLIGFFSCSLIALCPGAYFRLHYFILILPAIALLVGVAVSSATEKLAAIAARPWQLVPTVILLACFGYAISCQWQTYFSLSPIEVFRQTYPGSPFIAAVTVADYLKQNSPENAQIAVLGSEPEIYFYANRHSATGYLYMYSLIVRHKYTARMRQEMLTQLTANRPEYVIYVDVTESWGDRNGDPKTAAFLSALNEFMDRQYGKVGVAEIGSLAAHAPEFVWGDAAKTFLPQSDSVIYVLKRKQEPLVPPNAATSGAAVKIDTYGGET